MKRWIFIIILLPFLVLSQALFNTGFWQSIISGLGNFSIYGVQGTSDVTVDAWLVNNTEPKISFGFSSSATKYDIQVKDASGTSLVCQSLDFTPASTAEWQATSLGANVPTARINHTAVWTGSEMIIWGGADSTGPVNTGSKYNPTTDSWTLTSTGANVPMARIYHTAVWTGTEMIIWGGFNSPTYLNTGARYNPSADTWVTTSTTSVPTTRQYHSAIWTGTYMIIWGGVNGGTHYNTGSRYDPVGNTWAATSTGAGVPTVRHSHSAVWTGTEMIIWGGWSGAAYLTTGSRYNPTTNTWLTITSTNVPTGRLGHSTIWTGKEMLVWGGSNVSTYYNTGSRYNPTYNTWTSISTTNAPLGRDNHKAVWTGYEMMVWGGYDGTNYLNSGGRYNPANDTWNASSTTSAPAARRYHTVVWTGTEMIIWGGSDGTNSLNSGGKFYPHFTASLASCGLTQATSYKIYINAKAGTSTLSSSNEGFSFTVDNASPTANTITGITGAADSNVDAWLSGGLVPAANWNAFTGASSYDVTIKNSISASTICETKNTNLNTYTFTGCSLTNGTTYTAHITARSPSGENTTVASNSPYSFTVDNYTPGAFSITGITGGSDTIVNSQLTVQTDPTVNYGTSTNAYRFDITVKDSTGTTTLCSSLDQTGSPTALSTCGLTEGPTYKAYVTAKSISGGQTTNASNNGYSFTINTTPLSPGNFLITGATASPGDTSIDSWLTSGTVVTANWNSAAGATNYDVTIRDSGDTVDICTTQNTTNTSYTFTGCTLSVGTIYKIKVSANYSTAAPTPALNNGFIFQVVNSAPGDFTITGATGGTDSDIDAFLMNGTTVIANWNSSAGATSYDVTIKNSDNSATVCNTQNTATTNYTFSGCVLAAGNSYNIHVIAKNGSLSTSATNGPFTFYLPNTVSFCPTGSSTAKALIVYDSGGSAANYSSNETCNFTFSPPATASLITLNFGLFDSKDSADILTVYDGTNTSGTNLGSHSATSTAPANKTAASGNMYLTWVSGTGGGTSNAAGYQLNFKSNYSPPGTFSITGITGGTDVVADSNLTDNASGVTVTWSASSNASNYNVSIRNSANTLDICATQITSSTTYNFASCTLTAGMSYAAIVNSLDGNGNSTAASNNVYTFIYDLKPIPFTITGITGGTDSVFDNFLDNNQTVATVNWSASSGQTSYDVTIYESDGVTVKCATASAASGATSYNFSTCTLLTGTTYKVEVIAKNASGNTPAMNSLLTFGTGLAWSATSLTSVPTARSKHSAVWTGSEMIVWGGSNNGTFYNTGGRYNPTTDSWSPTSTGTNVPSIRSGHSAIWTGSEMIIWGGNDTTNYYNSGSKYNPSSNSWTTMANNFVASKRTGHTAIWTGTEMIIWGGNYSTLYLNTGGRYNPTTNTWNVSTLNVVEPRRGASQIWTGSEMIVWGGNDANTSRMATGGRYNPTTDSWSITSTDANVASERNTHTAIWTGTEMIIWGGLVVGGARTNTGARFNPSSNTWSTVSTGTNVPIARNGHSAIWTGTEMIIWGGLDGTNSMNTGGRYNPTSDSWTATSTGTNVPSVRGNHSAIWTGTEMIIWGGTASSTHTNTGGRYNPTSDSWTVTSTGTNLPAARSSHTVIWTGTEMIVWGGLDSTIEFNSGGKYNPSSDTWTTTSTGANVPTARVGHTSVWTGTEMIIWGGYNSSLVVMNNGGKYNPTSNTWSTVTTGANAHVYGYQHISTWTGSEMLVWGGKSGVMSGSVTHTGSKYNPTTDTWTAMNTGDALNVPEARNLHSSVWTGTEMIIWGGRVTGPVNTRTGGKYNVATDTWTTTLADTSSPIARYGHSAVWTGSEMIIWGGVESLVSNTGGKYNPTTNTWLSTSTGINVPSARTYQTAIWTGTQMIIWGGFSATNTGGKYNPTTNTWLSTSTGTNVPSARAYQTAIWTGTQMIIWGGDISTSWYDTGGVYRP